VRNCVVNFVGNYVVNDVVNDVVNCVVSCVANDVGNCVVSCVANHVGNDVGNDVVSCVANDVGNCVVSCVANHVGNDVGKSVIKASQTALMIDEMEWSPPQRLDDRAEVVCAEIALVGKFILLALAEAVVDEVNALLYSSRPRLLYRGQLEESAGSISGNIREALGRRKGPERNQFYRYSSGSAHETDDRLTRNFVAKRIKAGCTIV
jgi:four helix bundle protein